jgi:hypothetical protein
MMRAMLKPPPAVSALACAALLAVPSLMGMASTRQADSPRIVAIGDIHGAADELEGILKAAGLLGPDGHWSGGRTTFVQTGDCVDRGPGVKRVLDLLMQLESEARSARGDVELLLGNHEVLNILHDVTDVSAATFATFADSRSEDRRRKAFDDLVGIVRKAGDGAAPPSRDAWMASHPPGYVEYMDAMAPRGRYGRWLRRHKTIARVGRTAFMHAGISPGTNDGITAVNKVVADAIDAWDRGVDALVRERLITPYFSLKETVQAAATEMQRIATAIDQRRPLEERVTREYVDVLRAIVTIGESPLLSADGPLWFRGLSQSPTDETDAQVTELLDRLDSSRIVVGHTPQQPRRITPRFGNRVYAIDTGMLSSFFKGGQASALEVVGDQVTAIYVNERRPLVAADGR